MNRKTPLKQPVRPVRARSPAQVVLAPTPPPAAPAPAAPPPAAVDVPMAPASMHGSMITSLRLTFAAFSLVFRYPLGLVVPLFTLAWTGVLVLLPVAYVFRLYDTDQAAFVAFFEGLYGPTASAMQAGDNGAVFGYAAAETYLLYAAWLTLVLFGVLFFGTVSMDIATQQIKRQKVSLVAAFRVAGRNAHRIFLLALFNATVFTLVRYLMRRGFKGGRKAKAVAETGAKLVLTAITYVLLPIIVYERARPMKAMNSALDQIRKGWAGIVVGIGASFLGVWALFSFLSRGFVGGIINAVTKPSNWGQVHGLSDLLHLLGWDELGHFLPELIFGAVLFSVSMTLGAAMRATLYWNATTGEVPAGFRQEDLPQVAAPQPFTTPGVPA